MLLIRWPERKQKYHIFYFFIVSTLKNWTISFSIDHYNRITANWTEIVLTGYDVFGYLISCNSTQDWAKNISYAFGESNLTTLTCNELIGLTQYNVKMLVLLRKGGNGTCVAYQSSTASMVTPESCKDLWFTSLLSIRAQQKLAEEP